MNPVQPGWLDVARVVAEALDLPVEHRAAYLAVHCRDSVQRAEAERLWRACELGATSPVLDAPAVQFAAPVLAEVEEQERAVPEPLRAALAERYSIERELGRGGQATVYLARDERHGRLVALKLLHPALVSDDEPSHGATRFQREIELAARLSHPHILPLYDSGAAAGRLYYVTPYVDGESLRDRIARTGRLPLPQTVRVLRDVARALAHAHRHGVVHRDIKPGNILLNQEGDALVSDFGVARALAQGAELTDGALLGTPAYMAPEQVRGGPDIDHRADLYSFGIVAYVLLTGATPFAGRDRQELLAAHLSEVPEPVATRQSDVPPPLAALVDRLLAKRPSDRPRDAAEVLEVLDTVVTTSGQSVRRRQRGSRPLALAGGVLAVATVLAIGATLVARLASPPPVLAVGQLVERDESDSLKLAAVVGDMLALNLARVPGLRVVSRVRQLELMRQLGGGSLVEAARHAGATALLDGEVQTQRGRLQLVVRRVDLRTGSVARTHMIEGGDAFELADRATAELASSLGLSVGPLSVAEVTSPSLHAYRAYEDGLRWFGAGDYGRALERFESALTEDSLFAMAAFYAWHSGRLANRATTSISLGRLDSLAARAADRDRLLIRGAVAYVSNDPRGAAFGDSLAARFPVELDGLLLQAQARAAAGDLLAAIPLFRRVIAIDSLALREVGAAPTTHHRCLACTAYAEIANCYMLADSAAAAERVAREWMRRQPGAPEGWRWLGHALALQDRYEEAAAALRAAAAASRPDIPAVAFFPMIFGIVAGDFRVADSALAELARHGTLATQQDALWYRIISLRTQGRLREAFLAAERLEHLGNSGGVLQRGKCCSSWGVSAMPRAYSTRSPPSSRRRCPAERWPGTRPGGLRSWRRRAQPRAIPRRSRRCSNRSVPGGRAAPTAATLGSTTTPVACCSPPAGGSRTPRLSSGAQSIRPPTDTPVPTTNWAASCWRSAARPRRPRRSSRRYVVRLMHPTCTSRERSCTRCWGTPWRLREPRTGPRCISAAWWLRGPTPIPSSMRGARRFATACVASQPYKRTDSRCAEYRRAGS